MHSISGATRRLRSHFVLSGLPIENSTRIVSQIDKWLKCSGPAWTINRLKDMKLHVLKTDHGIESSVSWIGFHSDGSFKGPFKCLSNLSTKGKLSVLNAYTALVYDKAPQQKVTDTLNGIGDAPKLGKNAHKVDGLIHRFLEGSSGKMIKVLGDELPFTPAGLMSGKPQGLIHSQHRWISSFIHGLYNSPVADVLEKKFDFDSSVTFDMSPPHDDMEALSPGRLHFLTERGGKVRTIAVPNAAIQSAMYSGHMRLNRLLDRLTTDCTHNQEAGAVFAQDSLKKGKQVHSVDLSSATDRFPRHIQLDVLRSLGLDDEVRLLEYASSKPWQVPEGYDNPHPYYGNKDYISYGTGQPMGLYGSFATFGLTHNVMLLAICKHVGVSPSASFRVLGDDVIIADDTVHRWYRSALHEYGVPISQAKSVSSDQLAEFAGFIITRDEIYKPPKVASTEGRNFVSYLSAFGHQAISHLPSRVRKVARLFMELPDFLGGLGMNPSGKSLEERLDNFVFPEDRKRLFSKDVTSFLDNHLVASRFTHLDEAEREILEWLHDQCTMSTSQKIDNSVANDSGFLSSIIKHYSSLSSKDVVATTETSVTLSTWDTNAPEKDVQFQSDLDQYDSWFKP